MLLLSLFFRMAVDTSYIVAAQHKDSNSSEVYFSVSVLLYKVSYKIVATHIRQGGQNRPTKKKLTTDN